MQEHEIQDSIRLHISEQSLGTMFRANVGEAWTGQRVERLPDGSIRIYRPRRFSTGLPSGFPDLFGWCSQTVTAEILGQRVAIFAGIEVKSATGRVSSAQEQFLNTLRQAGSFSGVARSQEDAELILRGL